MLRLGSVFWSTQNIPELSKKFQALGFLVGNSRRYPDNRAVYFGPDAIELTADSRYSGQGITALEFDSDDIVQDYDKLKIKSLAAEKAQGAKDSLRHIPLWYGFSLVADKTPGIKAWVVMDSAEAMKTDESAVLPIKHVNTSFGLESVSFSTPEHDSFSKKWAEITQRPSSKISWNEFEKTSGSRVTIGDRFLDSVPLTGGGSGVFMLTVQTIDLEKAKEICVAAGGKVSRCASRDGFILDQSFLGGVHLRFIRSFWKPYIPETRHNVPFYRREDGFRPLGGSHTSTLLQGFDDHWEK